MPRPKTKSELLEANVKNFESLFAFIEKLPEECREKKYDLNGRDETIADWRSFTHWIGGMGVLVFVLVVVPLGGERSMHLMRAEVPGPTKGKLVPRMRQTAKILYAIYVGMTLLEMIFLCAGGMGLYDSALVSFGSAGTGGFLHYNDSMAHFNSAYFDYVTAVFMLLFGINFNLYYLIIIRQGKQLLKNEELRVYLGLVAFAVLTMMFNLRANYESYADLLNAATNIVGEHRWEGLRKNL